MDKLYDPNNGNNINDVADSGTIYIKLAARGTEINLGTIDINAFHWTTNSNQTRDYVNKNKVVTIYNSDLDDYENDKLFVIYKQGSIVYGDTYSCPHIITRPHYNLSPTSTTVSCNSSGTKNFTVINENSSPGTIQYHWNVGSGWMRNGVAVSNFTTTTNHITLVPYQYPPSDVHVTPILDGVAYDELTSTVSLSAFNPNLTVTGPASICSTGSYALQGSIPSNWSVVWSLQNTAIANLNQTGNNATVTVNTGQSGYITTNAFVTNSCGQTKVFPKQIFVGSPVVTTHQIYGGYDNMPVDSFSQLHVDWAQGNTSYLWTITTLSSSGSGTTPKFIATNSNTATTRYVTVNWGSRLGMYVVNCKATNSCSQTGISNKVVTVFDQSNNPCPPYNPFNKGENTNSKTQKDNAFTIKIFPNPINDGVINVRKILPSLLNPCNNSGNKTNILKEIKNTVVIYDFFGTIVYTKVFDTDTFKIENTKLKKGTYFLRITNAYGISKKTTLKVN